MFPKAWWQMRDIKCSNYQYKSNETWGLNGYPLGMQEECLSVFINVGAS